MAEIVQESTEIRDTDIVFDCPHCGKSLAIDYRGAGLSIPCSDCGRYVVVPIPEGMELSDIDSSSQDQEIRILNLRRQLSEAEVRISDLESEVEELRTRRELLERTRTDNMFKFGSIIEKIDVIRKAQEEIGRAVKELSEAVKVSE